MCSVSSPSATENTQPKAWVKDCPQVGKLAGGAPGLREHVKTGVMKKIAMNFVLFRLKRFGLMSR